MNGLPSFVDRPAAALADPVTPADAPVYATLALALDAGVPARIVLDGSRTLLLAVPLGQARRFLDDDPRSVVLDTTADGAVPDGGLLRALDAPAPRLTLLDSGAVADTVPVVVGVPFALTNGGDAILEVVVDSLVLTVGSLRSPGQYGSSIALRWRDLQAAANAGPVPATGDPGIPRIRIDWPARIFWMARR